MFSDQQHQPEASRSGDLHTSSLQSVAADDDALWTHTSAAADGSPQAAEGGFRHPQEELRYYRGDDIIDATDGDVVEMRRCLERDGIWPSSNVAAASAGQTMNAKETHRVDITQAYSRLESVVVEALRDAREQTRRHMIRVRQLTLDTHRRVALTGESVRNLHVVNDKLRLLASYHARSDRKRSETLKRVAELAKETSEICRRGTRESRVLGMDSAADNKPIPSAVAAEVLVVAAQESLRDHTSQVLAGLRAIVIEVLSKPQTRGPDEITSPAVIVGGGRLALDASESESVRSINELLRQNGVPAIDEASIFPAATANPSSSPKAPPTIPGASAFEPFSPPSPFLSARQSLLTPHSKRSRDDQSDTATRRSEQLTRESSARRGPASNPISDDQSATFQPPPASSSIQQPTAPAVRSYNISNLFGLLGS
jgi:hypothetical protein